MTSIPAVLDALVARVTGYANQTDHALYGVQVIDGQPTTNLEPDVLVIGFNPDRNSVEGQVSSAGLTAQRDSYAVACLASSFRGDETTATVRTRAFEILAAFNAVLALDRSFGGAALDSRVEVTEFDQQQTTDGAVATVAFTVRVSAFL